MVMVNIEEDPFKEEASIAVMDQVHLLETSEDVFDVIAKHVKTI